MQHVWLTVIFNVCLVLLSTHLKPQYHSQQQFQKLDLGQGHVEVIVNTSRTFNHIDYYKGKNLTFAFFMNSCFKSCLAVGLK